MGGYTITARGWAMAAVAVVLVALLVGGIARLVSPLFLEPDTEPSPTPPDTLFTFPPTATPYVTAAPPTAGPEPSPDASPSPAATPDVDTGSPPPAVITEPPAVAPAPPAANPAPRPPQNTPAPTPAPTPEPTPEPTPPLPAWALRDATVMFLWNSRTMADPEVVLADLADLLPSRRRLAGYVIIVDGFRSSDETRGRLAARRAAAVETLLIEEFSIDPAIIQTRATRPGHIDRTLQKVEIRFERVGDK